MKPIKIGEITIPVNFDNIIERTNIQRQIRKQPELPPSNTQDDVKIGFNTEEYRQDLVNVGFLEHLRHDILIPYPDNAWMESVLPDNSFTEVHSINYYQQINGDCELTHAMEDLYRILKPGGTAYIGIPNFDVILDKIQNAASEHLRLHWEHFIFSRNVDERGLFYNQSICDVQRITNRARHVGFRDIQEALSYGKDLAKYLTMKPDRFDLPGVDKEVRAEFNRTLKDKSIRRKKCIISRCVSKAGQQEFARKQSVYCRRHYRKAKRKLEEMQERALRAMVVLKKE